MANLDEQVLLSDTAATRIARLIETGTYKPGDQLPPELALIDSEFHAIPIEHCPNRSLRVLTLGVVAAMSSIVRGIMSDPIWHESSLAQHEIIAEAFENGDRELAAVLVGRHQVSPLRQLTEAKADKIAVEADASA